MQQAASALRDDERRVLGAQMAKLGAQNGSRRPILETEQRRLLIIMRIEDLPATPSNHERMRETVRLLNRRLADSNTPFRLRVL